MTLLEYGQGYFLVTLEYEYRDEKVRLYAGAADRWKE